MIYITGSREQNAIALRLVVQKVGGRPFSGEPKEEPLDPETEECLYIPSIAVTTVLAGGPSNMELANMLDKYRVSLRTQECNNVETGVTNVRLILNGPEDGRSVVHSYLSDRLAVWKSSGSLEKIISYEEDSNVLQSYVPNGVVVPTAELEASLKLTIPSAMIGHVLGTDDVIPNEIFRQTKATVRISPQSSPSIEVDLVVVLLTGYSAHILKAQEIILLRMLTSRGMCFFI
jgi:hypothetical protein